MKKMLDDRTFYKTVIQIEILSEGPFVWDELDDIHAEIMDGAASGRIEEVSQEELTLEELEEECNKHHTDSEFFLGEEDG